ncbi:MAG: Flp pilus assembly complex ATPase component TadA [Gammaproteobacteria bacterium]|nr:Flp pilus assembly complex ATPase component TadA [Gammaproteobacteria bacterium]
MENTIELPLPPLSSMNNATMLVNVMVTTYLIDNQKIEGILTCFDTQNSLIKVNIPGSQEMSEIEMRDLRMLIINKPLQLTIESKTVSNANILDKNSQELQDYVVMFKNNSKITGKTYGSRIDKNGIHLFSRTSETQKVKSYVHYFIPLSSIESQQIGEHIGETLIKEESVSREIIKDALDQQNNARERPIGEYLVSKEIVNVKQLIHALIQQKGMPNLKLGEILINENLVNQEELKEALHDQKNERNKPLGKILIEKGVVSSEKIQTALAKKLGIPFVNLREFKVIPEVVRQVPASLAFQHKLIPLYLYNGKLVIALENPMDWEALDALRFHTNKYIEPVMALSNEITWALQCYYSTGDLIATVSEVKEKMPGRKKVSGASENRLPQTNFNIKGNPDINDNAVVDIVNQIILDAYHQGASDIHIEPNPEKQKIVIRFRKDGTLIIYQKYDAQYRHALISRIKIMARLDISERRKPQDGKINFREFGPAGIELRVATLPTSGGLEDVVMRILSSGKSIPVNALGLSTENHEKLLDAISYPYGLFLVCGPTGSGKTTTLHSILGHLNDSERKIWTAEDPVEITQSGLRQVQINPRIGLDFATAMRAFLRADPDIIMIGEMRDTETAGMGIEASLTGHMVFSTLHTNSAPESITRLLDMGMDPFNFADALIGILAQRLAKKLCTSCKKAYKPSINEQQHLALNYCQELMTDDIDLHLQSDLVQAQVERWIKLFGINGDLVLYKAVGCSECNNSGYRGRIGLHELLVTTPDLKKMILERATARKIHEKALDGGMRTLRQDGIEKIMQGHTDFIQISLLCIK